MPVLSIENWKRNKKYHKKAHKCLFTYILLVVVLAVVLVDAVALVVPVDVEVLVDKLVASYGVEKRTTRYKDERLHVDNWDHTFHTDYHSNSIFFTSS